MAIMKLWQRLTKEHYEDAVGVCAMSHGPHSTNSSYGLLARAGTLSILLPAFRIARCLSVPISGGNSPSSG